MNLRKVTDIDGLTILINTDRINFVEIIDQDKVHISLAETLVTVTENEWNRFVENASTEEN